MEWWEQAEAMEVQEKWELEILGWESEEKLEWVDGKILEETRKNE